MLAMQTAVIAREILSVCLSVRPSHSLIGVMAIILRYFFEFSSFRGQLRKSG